MAQTWKPCSWLVLRIELWEGMVTFSYFPIFVARIQRRTGEPALQPSLPLDIVIMQFEGRVYIGITRVFPSNGVSTRITGPLLRLSFFLSTMLWLFTAGCQSRRELDMNGSTDGNPSALGRVLHRDLFDMAVGHDTRVARNSPC